MDFDTKITPTLGVFELGTLSSIFLFGVVTMQMTTYYQQFQKDTWRMKAFVGILWTIDLANTLLSAHSLYWFSVIKYGQQQYIDQFPASLAPAFVLSGVSGPAIQAFFTNCIRILTHQRISSWFLWILCFLRCFSLIGVAIAVHRSGSITDFRDQWVWLLSTSLVISTMLDVLITASMVYHLFHQRSTTLNRMKRVLDRLILWTIQTGMLTTFATITMLITFITASNFAWLAVFFVVSRLFPNSLLTLLNDRTILRSLGDIENTVQGFSDLSFYIQSTNVSSIYIGVTEGIETSQSKGSCKDIF